MLTETFDRYEYKYLLTGAQYAALLQTLQQQLAQDVHGHSQIRNVYYDTDSFRLIRRSIEKPVYKEKLRLRCYGTVKAGDTAFVELKKKYGQLVYKRRSALPLGVAEDCLYNGIVLPDASQIGAEIEYFRKFYAPLRPAMFLSYQREAYTDPSGGDLRVTFDTDVQYRCHELRLGAELGGTRLLERGQVLMEIKTRSAIPLWLTHALTKQRAYRTSFSKYDAAYAEVLQNDKGGKLYA